MSKKLGGHSSAAAEVLVSAVEELLAIGSENSAIYADGLQGLCKRVKSARTGFPLVLEERSPQEVNRLGSVLLGPVFTSVSHPWPVDAESKPMAPLCQLNTEHLPQEIEGVEGLIQVWMAQSGSPHGDSLIRVIPTAAVDASLMTPVIAHDSHIDVVLPDAGEWLREFHSEVKPSKKQYITAAAVKLGHASADELSDSDWDEWIRLADEYGDKFGDDVVLCWQIAGFEEGRCYCDMTTEQRDAAASLQKLKKKLDKKCAAIDAPLIPLLAKVCSAYAAWVEICGADSYPCLFGTFVEIQYSAAERDEPILCFESIGDSEWGDGGNAQVFFSTEKGLRFDWSCF